MPERVCVICDTTKLEDENISACAPCAMKEYALWIIRHDCPRDILTHPIPVHMLEAPVAALLLQNGCKEEAGAMPLGRVLNIITDSLIPEAPKTTPTTAQIENITAIEEQLACAKAEAHGLEYLNFASIAGFELLSDHGQDTALLLTLRALPIAHIAGSKEGEVVVAVADPSLSGLEVLQAEIKEYTGCDTVRLVVSPAHQIKQRLQDLTS